MDRTNSGLTLRQASRITVAMVAMLALQGCLATKIVTVPVKVAYGAGKLAVKGTAATIRAVVPDDEEVKSRQEPQDAPRPN